MFGFNIGGKTNAGGYFSPVVVGFPVVSSESDPIIVGSVLDCSSGAWIPLYEPINFSYQWYENGVAIDGETNVSVTTTSIGEYYCKVTATNDLKNSTTVRSNRILIEQPQALELTWDDIANVPVADASSLTDWNTFFDLPTNGTPFTSVIVVGNGVNLFGGSGINLRDNLFSGNTNLLSVDDTANCITTAGDSCFDTCTSITTFNLPSLTTAGDSCFESCTSVTTFNLPLLTTAGDGCFNSCSSLTTIDLPELTTAGDGCFSDCSSITSFDLSSCTNLGTTVGDNSVFLNITGNTITLTVPSSLMTCDSGNPDGDIQYLQANNSLTIITV